MVPVGIDKHVIDLIVHRHSLKHSRWLQRARSALLVLFLVFLANDEGGTPKVAALPYVCLLSFELIRNNHAEVPKILFA